MTMVDIPVIESNRSLTEQTAIATNKSDWLRAALARIVQKKYLWLALRIMMSVAVFALIFRKLNISALASVLQQMNPGWAVLGLLVGVLTVVLSAWQWQVLLRGEAVQLSFFMTFMLYYIGIAFNQLLPSSIGGDVAKAAYAARLTQRKVNAVSATVMARIIGLAALLLTSLPVALVASFAGFSQGWPLTLILALVTFVYVDLLVALLMGPLLLQRLLPKRVLASKIGKKALDFADILADYRQQPRLFLQATLISALFYAASNLNFYCFGLALHIQAPFWFYWIGIPLSALATMLPISLNGYGVRGATFVALFALMGVAGVAALSMSFEMEVQMLLFAFVGAAMLPAVNQRIAQNKRINTFALESSNLIQNDMEDLSQ